MGVSSDEHIVISTYAERAKVFNLRRDPFERAQLTSNTYYDWLIDRAYLLVPAQAYVVNYLKTFAEFPRRAKPATFGLDQVMEKLAPPSH